MEELCTVCLCTDRKMCLVETTNLYHIYMQILSEISELRPGLLNKHIDLSKRLVEVTHDPRAGSYFCQRVSIAVQRGNAASLMGTLPRRDVLEEVYSLDMCVQVCWECHALMNKFDKFKEKVKTSYFELSECVQKVERKHFMSKSNLRTEHYVPISYPDLKTEQDTLSPYSPIKIEHDIATLVSNDDGLTENSLRNGEDTLSTNNKEQELDKKDSGKFTMSVAKLNSTTINNLFSTNAIDSRAQNDFVSNVTSDFVTASDRLTDDGRFLSTGTPCDKDDNYDHYEDTFADDLFVDGSKKKVKKKKKTRKKQKVKLKNKKKKVLPAENIELSKKDLISEEVCELNEEVVNEKSDQKDTIKTEIESKSAKKLNEEHEVDGKPTCGECGKVFSSKKTLRSHLKVLHGGQNRYPCPRCGKEYQWKSNLGRHLRTHKARDAGELYCELCDKRFASVATYRQHIRISKRHVTENEFNFMCNECGKKFVSKTRLRDHIDWDHLKKIKFTCQLCTKPFKSHTSLYIHMQNVHRNKEKKDNLCHVCGKAYQNGAKLKYHIIAMHSGETPYRCGVCAAAFGWHASLYRHIREVHYKIKVQPNKKTKKKKLEDAPAPPQNQYPRLPVPQTKVFCL